jgi:indolepyruvate decarboxylase
VTTEPFARATDAPTVAEYLLSRLVAAGARHVFGVPGDFNLRLLDAVVDHPELDWVGTANELNGAYAADGYARVGGFGVVLTTYGVGELSALNGLAGSFAEAVPVLHVVGSPATAVRQAGTPVHHSLLDGDMDHFVRALDEVTCASAVLTAENAAREIDRVLSVVLERKRPGSISVPSDLVDTPITLTASAPSAGALSAAPVSALVESATAMLESASSVVVLVDHLARHGVTAELDALVRVENVASAVTVAAKGLIDESVPGFLGVYVGGLSDEAVRSAVEDADVVIGVGLWWADLSSGGFTVKLDPARLIDVQPARVDVAGEVVDGLPMANALATLSEILADRARLPVRAALPAPPVEGPPLSGALTQAVFWERFQWFLRPGDIVAVDQGTASYGLTPLRLPTGVDVIAQSLWCSIGYALPAALGAQIAAGGRRRVVLVTGDGAAQMTIQELGTFIRRGLDPVVIVFNNDGYTVERAIRGPNAVYNDVAHWNWRALPAAFGAPDGTSVHRVETSSELDKALAACDGAAGALAFVEVVLDRLDVPALLNRATEAVARQNEA